MRQMTLFPVSPCTDMAGLSHISLDLERFPSKTHGAQERSWLLNPSLLLKQYPSALHLNETSLYSAVGEDWGRGDAGPDSCAPYRLVSFSLMLMPPHLSSQV